MSKLLIAAKTDRTDVLAALHKLLPGVPLSELRQHLSAGTPFVERLYPMNDREEVASLFRKILAELDSKSIEAIGYDLREEDEFDPITSADKRENAEVIENILHRAEQISEDFDDLEKEGHGW